MDGTIITMEKKPSFPDTEKRVLSGRAVILLLSAALVLICLMRIDGPCRVSLRKLRLHREPTLEILRVGLPAGLQGCIFSISNVLIQSFINSFGSAAMAGIGAAKKAKLLRRFRSTYGIARATAEEIAAEIGVGLPTAAEVLRRARAM